MEYFAFGLALRADRAIPGLRATASGRDVDVHIRVDPDEWPLSPTELSAGPWYTSPIVDEDAPALLVWKLQEGARFRWLYRDGTEFVVDRAGRHVWARWPSSSTFEDTATYLLGPVLGFVLRLRGITCLHASAAVFGSRAVAFLGSAGAGKSTIVAACADLAYPVLSDDIVALDERDEECEIRPAYPQLRLWPESVELLYGRSDALPPLTPTWDKRARLLHDDQFQAHPVPLAAIYVLADEAGCITPRIEPCHGRERLVTLLAHSYVNYLLDSRMRDHELRALAALAARVPVRKLIRDRARPIRQLCAAVLNDCEALGCTPSPTTVR